jgi:hypothetical protein
MKQADDLIPGNDPESKRLTIFLIPEMPVLLIIKRTISAPPLEVTNVRIIVLWVQCSTDGDKVHSFYKSWSARTRKLLCCVHVSVSLFFLIVALSRVSFRLISEISIDQELLFRYGCQYIISPALALPKIGGIVPVCCFY